MRIGFAKPDFGIQGGFELVLATIARHLTARGHDVQWLTVPVASLGRRVFGIDIPDDVWHRGLEFFTFGALADAFRQLDTRGCDVVVTTQPPSYAVEHDRKLALFYHHQRVFYDLSDVFVRAGFAVAAEHIAAQEALRAIDRPLLSSVTHFLAGSANVARRLSRYNAIRDNVSLFHASLPQEMATPDGAGAFAHALCVSRHEFPKRTELFVHAMKFLPSTRGVCVGSGGRLAWVRSIDITLSEVDPSSVDAQELWLRRHTPSLGVSPAQITNVEYVSGVSSEALSDLYRDAICVVAPAYDEDYGLTAMEAMAYGKPVIVCDDGGGLTEMVQDGVNGFVVAPQGRAIADAISRLAEDRSLAEELGTNGRRWIADFTWERAMAEFEVGLAAVS